MKSRIDKGEHLNIIDVREPDEYAEYNIGGKLIPLGKIMSMQLDELEDLRNDELIIHCKMGGRSMQACMMLEQAGFLAQGDKIGSGSSLLLGQRHTLAS